MVRLSDWLTFMSYLQIPIKHEFLWNFPYELSFNFGIMIWNIAILKCAFYVGLLGHLAIKIATLEFLEAIAGLKEITMSTVWTATHLAL